MSATNPGLPILQPELRALDVVDVNPAGHFGMFITGDDFAPHLRPGEIAVVDTTDKERILGELYVVDLGPDVRTGAPRRLRIVEVIKSFGGGEAAGIWFAFSLMRDVDLGDGRKARMVDGPLGFDHWPRYCQGRIVGVMVPDWQR